MRAKAEVQLASAALFEALVENNVSYFCGVPDSTLAPFCSYLGTNAPNNQHTIAANEGNAIGLAIGYYLATSGLALVYLQNSGIGNALDPILSLADSSVMGIPMLLLIGWRGEPGKKDEPQHSKQGAITKALLDLAGIKFEILSAETDVACGQIREAAERARRFQMPVALLVQDGTLEPYPSSETKSASPYTLTREEALAVVFQSLDNSGRIVATNGKASREIFEYRDKAGQGHEKDLLVVGGMGHASSIALTIAQNTPSSDVYCIDGDGSLLMHMGALAIIGSEAPKNFVHIIINNGSHDSTGGQPTVGFSVNILGIALAAGYKHTEIAKNEDEIRAALKSITTQSGPTLIEIRVKPGARNDLMRPTISPKENKQDFIAGIQLLKRSSHD